MQDFTQRKTYNLTTLSNKKEKNNFLKAEGSTNIEKYRVAVYVYNITEYYFYIQAKIYEIRR